MDVISANITLHFLNNHITNPIIVLINELQCTHPFTSISDLTYSFLPYT